ncbi:hypothetical protein PM082_004498 [Marasmius tenuissimus]|nr:hypothetical protein PM082_004498 [Marasmius tenuissimus]
MVKLWKAFSRWYQRCNSPKGEIPLNKDLCNDLGLPVAPLTFDNLWRKLRGKTNYLRMWLAIRCDPALSTGPSDSFLNSYRSQDSGAAGRDLRDELCSPRDGNMMKT